jgi:hypothetical protein
MQDLMMYEQKKINITGVNNKYQMNKLMNNKNNNEIKKRVISKKWDFSEDYFLYDKQLIILNKIYENSYKENCEISKIVVQEINKKIYGYKQQDIMKKHFDDFTFINFNCIIDKMIKVELKCYYCNCEMSILYDISREMKQWSVDRIDNDKGHNINNFHLACLDCNLKRRRRTDEKFLFTKQLNIIKQDK